MHLRKANGANRYPRQGWGYSLLWTRGAVGRLAFLDARTKVEPQALGDQ